MQDEDRKVLIIGNENEFLVKSICNVLKSKNYDVAVADTRVDSVGSLIKGRKVCLLFIESTEGIKDLLVYLKDVVFDKSVRLGIVGEMLELQEAVKFLQKETVSRLFERPVDTKMIYTGIDEMYNESRTENERKKILVVDDDPAFLRRSQELLKKYYKVYTVTTGASAIMLLTKHTVDLILLDYEMPVVSGTQVYEMIKAEPSFSSIPIMFLTGKSDIYSVADATRLKPEKYMLKSMPVDELMTTLAEFFKVRPAWTL